MADFHSTGWVAGETVTATAVSATPPGNSGASVASGTAGSSGAVDFTGLATETNYRATGGTSGRRVNFRIGVPPEVAQSGSSTRILVWDADEEAYSRAEWWGDTSVPRVFYGPTDQDPRQVDGITIADYDMWRPISV